MEARADSVDSKKLRNMGIRSRRKNSKKTEPSSRRSQVTEQDLMDAAVRLLGTHRSVSTLSLREIAREAGIAPNSFYRHFRDVDELTVALIDQAGRALRGIIREARQRLSMERSAIRTSVEAFMDQLDADEKYLQVLLREMSTGSDAFRQAVERELNYFEDELRDELERMEKLTGYAYGGKCRKPSCRSARRIDRPDSHHDSHDYGRLANTRQKELEQL